MKDSMITGLAYQNGLKKCERISSAEHLRQHFGGENTWVWLDLEAPSQEELSFLENPFHFHPLTIEDCINHDQRAKVEDYQDYLFMVTQCLTLEKNEIETHELDIYVSRSFLVTVHREPISAITTILERCERNPALTERGPDFLLYLLIDAVVDGYFPLLDELDDRIDSLESHAIDNPSKLLVKDIFSLKRMGTHLRKIIAPQRELFTLLMTHRFPVIREETLIYFRDIYDHIMRIYERIDYNRDILSSLLDTYLSSVSNHTNNVVKTLTILATIFMPLTFLSGIFGMNFHQLPVVGWEWSLGFEMFFGLSLLTILSMVALFKKKKWF